MRITNASDINLPLAVWLLHDEYDYINEPNYVSVTSLMRPLKQIVLAGRIPAEERTADVEDYIARALGHAIHDSIEKAWVKGHARSMKLLGYPASVIERVVVNPTEEQLRARNDIIPVYIEKRAFRSVTIDGVTYKIGGKFDMTADGTVFDNKSTSAFSWLFGTKDEEHRLQLSLYKWLNPDKITESRATINYIFTDWSKMQARSNPNYPQKRVEQKHLDLLSEQEVDNWVKNKLRLVAKYRNSPEYEIPECTDEELWRSAPSHKYYSDPSKTDGRSSKNFDNLVEANNFKAEKGKGIVITVPGEVKACGYCPAFDVCKQKDQYLT